MENKVEIWKAHPEYAGIEVSTLGRVRTLDKMVRNGSGIWLMKGRILKPASDKDGYLTVAVKVNDKFISKKVHRLTAQTFIQNPDNLPQVNHKNCVRDDNRVSNLEWCTASYNSRYREKHGVSRAEAAGKPVFAINLETIETLHFRAQQKQAARSELALEILTTSLKVKSSKLEDICLKKMMATVLKSTRIS